MNDERDAPLDTEAREPAELLRWLVNMGWEPGENCVSNVAGNLALSRMLTARSLRSTLAAIEGVPDQNVLDRKLLDSLLLGELAVIDAVEKTFATIVKPEYANGVEIGRVFREHVRRSRYAAQYDAASTCFLTMKKLGVPFERVPLDHRLALKLAMRPDFVGRLTVEELSGEDFDRELVEIANHSAVQSALYTAGARRAAGVFLKVAVGVPESTGRSWLTKQADVQSHRSPRTGSTRRTKSRASARTPDRSR